jgi:hypothetical protein
VEKVGNSLKEDLAKPGYKSKHESTKRSGWLDWPKVTGTHVGLHNGLRPWAPTSVIIILGNLSSQNHLRKLQKNLKYKLKVNMPISVFLFSNL